MDAFTVFLHIFNTREPPIKFKSSVSISSIDFLDTTAFKDPYNSTTLLTKVFFKPTDTPVVTQGFFSSKTHIQGFNKSPK